MSRLAWKRWIGEVRDEEEGSIKYGGKSWKREGEREGDEAKRSRR